MLWRRAFIVLGIVAIGVACRHPDYYVYTARRFDADAGCLDPYKSIERVAGDSVSSKCAPICFAYGGETFTSTVCPPLPDNAVALDAQAPECQAANALYETTCGADAGPEEDAAPEEDAGPEPLDAADDAE